MDYPVELLPCSGRKLIEETLSDFYLIRFFNVFKEHELISADGKLNSVYIFGESNGSTRRFIDLSTVLYGIYREEHVKLQLTAKGVSEYKDYCAPDCTITAPKFNTHFIIDEEMLFWAIKISDVETEKLKHYNVNLKKEFEASCKILHTPKKSNFWHYSIDWENEEGLFKNLKEEDKKFEKKAKKRFGKGCRELLKRHIILNCPPDQEIPKNFYLK